MDSFAKSTSTKRFVVEDTFTKVTSDGQPHGMMTMIAAMSGLLAAIVILTVLASIIGCKKSRRSSKNCKNCPVTLRSKESVDRQTSAMSDDGLGTKRFSLLSLLRRGSSITKDTLNDDADTRPRLVSISCISNGNFEGNLNTAFTGSDFSLSGSLRKTRRQDVVSNVPSAAKETIIDMEKY